MHAIVLLNEKHIVIPFPYCIVGININQTKQNKLTQASLEIILSIMAAHVDLFSLFMVEPCS
jgi:hypothetical protein